MVIAVIHDLNLAAQYCDRLVLLHGGKIFSLGSQEEVLTAEHIKSTFGADVIVKMHALTNQCYLSPSPIKRPPETSNRNKGTIHLICGGGEGASSMHLLTEKGYKVTAGVLNLLDTDCEVAKLLDIPVVTEAPFSTITTESFEAHLALIGRADAVVLCGIPFGFGNLKNLEAAEAALRMDKLLLAFDADNLAARDFTGGVATKRFIQLQTKGAVIVKSQDEMLSVLAKR
ncbi:Cobalamin import ATP-binding protein BtuD [ANME-1 cluster archaeon GoMg3.2]|nr:Cobalamin import ATP-binding protein BtuD [ANME-1 cluster archaeon GoMg3.2]